LVQVQVTSDYVWALCIDDATKASQLLYRAIAQADEAIGWSVAALGHVVEDAVEVGEYDLPEGKYAECIFQNGTFSSATLRRALNLRSPAVDWNAMGTLSEIQAHAAKVMAEETVKVAGGAGGWSQRVAEITEWQSLLDDCVGFWHEERRPRGLFVDNGVAFVVTEVGVEQVRMCLPGRLETLSLLESPVTAELDGLPASQQANDDFRYLLGALRAVRSITNRSVPVGFVHAPLQSTKDEIETILNKAPTAADAVCAKLIAIRKLPEAASRLLKLVEAPAAGGNERLPDGLLNGSVGNAVLASELEHHIRDRAMVCRGLLQLTDIAFQRRAELSIDGEDSAKIAAEVRPKAAKLLRRFSILLWAANQRTRDGNSSILSPFVEQYRSTVEFPFDQNWDEQNGWTLIEWSHLQSSVASALLEKIAAPTALPLFLMQTKQYEVVKQYVALVDGFKGPLAYLLGRAYLHSNDYQKAKSSFLAAGATLSTDGDADGILTTLFRDGNDDSSEMDPVSPVTQVAYFTRIATFFEAKIPHRHMATSTRAHQHLLQLYAAPQMVIEFTKEAINALEVPVADGAAGASDAAMIDPEDAEFARDELQRLRSMLIKHLLLLGQHDIAMALVVSLPQGATGDRDAQTKFLHLVVKQLCEREDYVTIVENTYSTCGLEPEVVDVLRLKAVHTDIEEQIADKQAGNYYHVLFSFHIHRGNFKEASYWMFQLARRLREHIRWENPQEMYTLTDQRENLCSVLQCMCDAYASAISTLQLVSKDHQWHTESAKSVSSGGGDGGGPQSKRSRTAGPRGVGGDGNGGGGRSKQRYAGMELVSLDVLKRELLLARSEWELAKYGGNPPAPEFKLLAESQDGEEAAVRDTVQRLVTSSMFDTAMSLAVARCSGFDGILHSRTPLVPTPARLKLLHACA
jgi:hypothetical protein